MPQRSPRHKAESDRQRGLLQASATAAAGGALALSGVRWWLDGPWTAAAMVLMAAGVGFAAVAVLATVRARYARQIMVVVPCLSLSTLAGIDGGLTSDAVYWMPLIPLVAALLLGGRGAIGFGILTIASLAGIWIGQDLGWIETSEFGSRAMLRFQAASGAVAFGGAVGWIYEKGRLSATAALIDRERLAQELIAALPDTVVHLSQIDSEHTQKTVPREVLTEITGLRTGSVCRVASGSSHFEIRKLRIRTGVVGLVRNVTAQHAVERLKDDIIRTISHEIRTPVTALHGSVQMMKLPDEPDQRELVEIAKRNAKRLTFLVEDLFDLYKAGSIGDSFDKKPVLLVHQVREAIADLSDSAETAGVTLTMASRVDVVVLADVERLRQILGHVLINAVTHSCPGQRVEIAVGPGEHQGWTRVEVRDHGPGIPVSFQPQVFLPFTQADSGNDRSFGGSGLGMAVAQELAESMGWRIDFDSKEGEGTTFWVDLPHESTKVVSAMEEAWPA